MAERPVLNRDAIHDEMEEARATLQRLLQESSAADLRRRSSGTRWTNEQLLFHMVFGYLVVRTLLPLVRAFGRLPDGLSRGFARILNSGTRPFHLVNYVGSCIGAMVFRGPRMAARLDRTVASLHRRLDAETESALDRGMHFPRGWDPLFTDTMTLAEVYHYATQHFDLHRSQLSLGPSTAPRA
jgi:hypothetical protein